MLAAGALLGSEASGLLWFGVSWRTACKGFLLVVFWVVCWLFENCIVDASIFVVFVVFCKLLSVIGGCLGTKSR